MPKLKKMIERKIRYDQTIVEHDCILLETKKERHVLFHKIETPFSMTASERELTIRKGSYTLAFYWEKCPYNVYIWRDEHGKYLGAYFNIVKNTYITEQVLSFEDLIIDVLVFPDGRYFVLDEDELPKPLAEFEKGDVQASLNSLLEMLDTFLPAILSEKEHLFKHEKLLPLLGNN